MKATTRGLLGLGLVACLTLSQAEAQQAVAPPSEKPLCLFSGVPPADYPYTSIKKLKAAKGTYGDVAEVSDRLIEDARTYGADAIINYTGSQRFGFWPWRIVRPVARGVAIRWSRIQPRDCASIGGIDARELRAPSEPTQSQASTAPADTRAGLPETGGSDAQARLQDLKQAYEQGLISKAEYDLKRAEVLKNL